jgi:hypothetical protein
MSGLTKGNIKITPHERDDNGGVIRESEVVAEVKDIEPKQHIKLGVLLGIDHQIREFTIGRESMYPGKHSTDVEDELNKAYPVHDPKVQKWVGFFIRREFLPAPNQPFNTVLHLTNRHSADEPIRWVIAYHDKSFDKDSCDGKSTITHKPPKP